VGNGTDLTILAQDNDYCSEGGSLNFLATYTGQYAVAIGGYHEIDCCDYSVTLSGNAGSVSGNAVPTMSIYGLVLTTLGLLLIATRRLLSRKIKAG
jgi:hypothetical protein